MTLKVRKYYIDNLRWLMLLILIPYHTAMAWNTWGEPNYIFFEGNPLISSFIVFFSPYFMSLLFVLAGISTKYALRKRTMKEYFCERTKKLLIPFFFGTIIFMPIMSYLGDKFNYAYDEGFLKHYIVFFTKYTDLTGADGGFSVGQFWFLLYLFIISIISMGIIALLKKTVLKTEKIIPLWIVLLLGFPLPFFDNWLSVGGKSLAEYTYFFIAGYCLFSDEKIISKPKATVWLLLGIGLTATVMNVYLFLWADKAYPFFNEITQYVSKWIMVTALLILAKRYLNINGKVSDYMTKRSFLIFIYHFIWVVLFQYILYDYVGNRTLVLFMGTVLLSYFATFICCEISIRIPILCLLTGTKYNSKREI